MLTPLLLLPLLAGIFLLAVWLLVPDLSLGAGYMIMAVALGSFLAACFLCEMLLSRLVSLRACPHCGARRWRRLHAHGR